MLHLSVTSHRGNIGVQMFRTAAPRGAGGCLWVLVLSDTPSLTGKVQAGGAHWQQQQLVVWAALTPSILAQPSLRQHVRAGGRLEMPPATTH